MEVLDGSFYQDLNFGFQGFKPIAFTIQPPYLI
jgi:hypothetical protein